METPGETAGPTTVSPDTEASQARRQARESAEGSSAAVTGLGRGDRKGGFREVLKQVRWAALNPDRSSLQEEMPAGPLSEPGAVRAGLQ